MTFFNTIVRSANENLGLYVVITSAVSTGLWPYFNSAKLGKIEDRQKLFFDKAEFKRQELQSEISTVNKRVSAVEGTLEGLENRITNAECKVDSLGAKMDSLEIKMDFLELKMDSVNEKMEKIAIYLGVQ
ncbi:hypothetical protein MP228_008701 [Amoeboaphelidium protococcarum]|nr:hypothetical protein MP228_008701 [Amoeboaphelidium protococcarum]